MIVRFLWEAITDIFYFAILLIIFLLLFGMIGFNLFANKVKLDSNGNIDMEHGESMRVTFDTIGYSVLAAFTLLIGDNWTTYFYQYTRFSKAAYAFFPLAIVVLNIIIINLFTAIILEKFFSDDQKESIEKEEKLNKAYNEQQKRINAKVAHHKKYKNRVRTLLTALKAYNVILSLGGLSKKKTKAQPIIVLNGVSLGVFERTSDFRIKICKIIRSKIFRAIGYALVVFNSLVVTYNTPLHDPNSRTLKVFKIINYIASGFFALEICLKVIAYGFLMNGPDSFMRTLINIIDLLGEFANLIHASDYVESITVNQILCLLQVLRMFRFMTINRGFRLKTQAIINGSPKVLKIMAVTFMFIWMFAIIGMQLYKGLFYYCSSDNVNGNQEIRTVYDCMNNGGDWQNRDINFDNIFMGILTLFEMLTGKSWCSMITYLQDFRDYDYEPKRNVSVYHLWYPIVYMVFSYLFMRSLLLGVINNTFYYHNEELQGLRELTSVQRRWVSLTRIIFKASPIKEYHRGYRFYSLYEFLSSNFFNRLVTSVICLNGIVCCMTIYNPSRGLEIACEAFYTIFMVFYIIEAILKILFYRKYYFMEGWNLFDFVCIILLFIFTSLDKLIDSHHLKTLLFVSRSFKIFGLFHKFGVLRNVFQIFTLALPSVINLALMLFITMYVFAVIGIILFSTVKIQGSLSEHANFKNLLTAFFTIYRISTYDGWIDIMHDTMREENSNFYCVNYPTYDDMQTNGGSPIGCGVPYSPIYFILCIVVIPFVFVNIFVAIVVAIVMEIAQLSKSVLSDERLNSFLLAWKKHDPDAKGYIEYSKVWNLLYDTPEPLGASESEMGNRFYCAITLWMLQLKIYKHQDNCLHYVAFYDVLEGLVKKTLYKPQTLNKIYHNVCKEMLIKGLQELWFERTQLEMSSDIYVKKIEDLKYYYRMKTHREEKSKFKTTNVSLPSLVWIILKISDNLKRRIKARKKLIIEDDKSECSSIMRGSEDSLSMAGVTIYSKRNLGEISTVAKSKFSNEVAVPFLVKSITKEADSLSVINFGGQRFDHNIPKMSEKMKPQNRRYAQTPKHNVPITFTINENKFLSDSSKNSLS